MRTWRVSIDNVNADTRDKAIAAMLTAGIRLEKIKIEEGPAVTICGDLGGVVGEQPKRPLRFSFAEADPDNSPHVPAS